MYGAHDILCNSLLSITPYIKVGLKFFRNSAAGCPPSRKLLDLQPCRVPKCPCGTNH